MFDAVPNVNFTGTNSQKGQAAGATPTLKYDDKFGQEMTYWMRMMKSIPTQNSK